jgi:hypothetical protein
MTRDRSRRASRRVAAGVGLAFALVFAAAAATAQTQVGDTKDGCDKSNVVSFKIKGGSTFKVKAGEKNKEADFPAPVGDFEWFCGGSQEFSSNDVPFDRIRVTRADNGAIHFFFFRIPPPSGGNVQTANVGDTADGCHKQHSVTLTGVDGKVSVAASETKIVDLPAATKTVDFKCGNDDESASNDTFFDRVRVSRNINGAIQWTFYVKSAAADPKGVCDKVHATGRLVFKDENGATVGLGSVHVKLMDDDFGPTSSTMAQGWTDSDGRFDLTGSGHDSGCVGAGCRRPDPFVEFILGQAHRVDVKDAVENTSRQQSDTKANTCGDVDFGDQMWSNHELDPILYARTQLVYDDFVKQTGDTRVPGHEGVVGVEYPTIFIGTAAYTTWDTIHWPYHGDQMTDFNGVDHEFGHRLRHAADGDRAHFDWDASRFVYGRNHSNRDVSNEGFAFNEGWAYYFETVRPHGMSFPNGTWTTPTGDDVEGDVANQLFNLSAACGGFKRMWHTLKDSGHNSIHSVDEFRAAFLQRNPGCVAAGAVPTRTPTNSPPPPTPTRSIKGIPGPSITGLPLLTPTASSRGPLPRITSITQPLVTPTPSKQGLSAEESARLRAENGRRLDGRLDPIAKREAVARDTTRLRIPADIPAAARPAVERLNVRHAELEGAFHAKSLEAYRAAYDSLSTLTRDSLSDGTYEKARAAAKDVFAEKVFAARRAHLQEGQRAIDAERKKTRDPKLVAYLARLRRSYERAEVRLEAVQKNRQAGEPVPPDLLPATFVGKTTRR